MNQINLLTVAFLLNMYLVLPMNGWSQNSFQIFKAEELNMSSDSLQKLSKTFQDLVDQKQLAGAQIAILRKGKLIQFESIGYSNIESKKRLDEKSIFRIFSMTKPIVSVALMQLYEEGKFQLEDPLHSFVPSFKNAWTVNSQGDSTRIENPIRIIDLLRHTSGISYGRTANEKINEHYRQAGLHSSKNNEEFVNKLAQLPLSFEPGTNWEYGMSTNVCGRLVEILSGKSLDEYLYENIFVPLNMTNTYFQIPDDKKEQFTVGYGVDDEGKLTVREAYDNNRYLRKVTLFNGGGGLVSTTEDYINFCLMLSNWGEYGKKRLLKSETVQLMTENHLLTVQAKNQNMRLPNGDTGFGLGFAVHSKNDPIAGVYGWGGAVGTYFRIDPQSELIYIMMIQLSPHQQLNLRTRFQNMVRNAIIE